MTPSQITEVHHRARQDAHRHSIGWTVTCPFHTREEVDLYDEIFRKALDEAKGKK